MVAERISDGSMLHLIQMWLKAPVVEKDEEGTKRYIGGGKSNRRGTPQGGVISPLLSNLLRNCSKRMLQVRTHLEDRLQTHLRRRYKIRNRGSGTLPLSTIYIF